jgi:hypothetical protein
MNVFYYLGRAPLIIFNELFVHHSKLCLFVHEIKIISLCYESFLSFAKHLLNALQQKLSLYAK